MLTLLRSGRHSYHALPHFYSADRQSHLLGYLLLGYGLLIVTGSLYPFTGWRWPAQAPWSFLTESWPRYLLSWEIPLNVAGYVPWGMLLAVRLLATASMAAAIAGAALGGLATSLVMETLQVFISSRIASNLDVASNGLGALLGAVLAVSMERAWDLRSRFRRLRRALFVEGHAADLTTALLLAWLFAQINPGLGLLATAGVAQSEPAGAALVTYSAASYFVVETLLTCMNALYLLALLRLLTRSTQASLAGGAALMVASAALKSLGGALLVRLPAPWLWATPGALAGVLLAAVVFILWCRQWPDSLKRLGLLSFAGALVLALLLPANPYLAMSLQPVVSGHLSHLQGATWWAAQSWPWVALLCIASLPTARVRSRFLSGH